MTASRSSSVQHTNEACRMRLSFSNSLYCLFFRNDIVVVHAIGGLPRLVNTSLKASAISACSVVSSSSAIMCNWRATSGANHPAI